MLRFFSSILFGISVYTCTFAQGKLIFAIDIVRHGDRTPIIVSPEMEKVWPQGVGQLTPTGMRQEYELGKLLRQYYIDQHHLLPENYDINAMYVRSSGIPRTLMSAQSILLGLYPLSTGPSLNESTKALPEGFQPIPINTVSPEQDMLLLPNHDKKMQKKLLDDYVFNSPEWLKKDLELRHYYPAWSEIFGSKIDGLYELISFSDRLMIERLYNRPLPVGLQEREADRIIEAGKWAFLTISNHPKFALMMGGGLAQTIKHELNLATEQNRPLKYLLFVAHDTTIMAQLKLLGQTIDDIPPYASQINYSLFDEGFSHYELRVTYNHNPLFIKQCGGKSCTMTDFNDLIDNQSSVKRSSYY